MNRPHRLPLMGGYALAFVLALVVSAPTSWTSTVAGHGTSASGTVATSGSVLAQWEGYSLKERAEVWAAVVDESEANLSAQLAERGYTNAPAMAHEIRTYFLGHPAIVAHPADLNGLLGGLIGAAAGCAIGGFVGSFVPVVGTAAGCAIGAVATLLGIIYFTQSAGGLGILHEDGIVRGQVQAFDNAMNASVAFLTNSLSIFNATLYAWNDAVDSVAVNQLGNSSFNYTLAVAQSGIEAVFDSVIGPYVAQTSLDLANLNEIFYQLYSTPGLSNVHDYAGFGSGACLGVCASVLTWYGGFSSFFESGATSGQIIPVEILPFGPVHYSASGGPCSIFNLMNNSTTLTVAGGSSAFVKNWTNVSGGFLEIAGPSATCELDGPGVISFAANAISGSASLAIVDATCGKKANPGSCNPLSATRVTQGQTPDAIGAFNSSGGPSVLVPNRDFLGGVFYAYQKQFDTMTHAAMANAYTYWLFLRTLGYHSYSQIPSDCLIPAPDLAVPPVNLAATDYSLNYTEASYVAKLQALATFFDTPYNTSNFCNGHPQRSFVLTDQTAPPFGENLTGFVLTLPKGTHQLWKSPHTWAVNGTNTPVYGNIFNVSGKTNASPVGLTIWPSVVTYGYAIPLDTVVEVPLNDPMEVDVLQNLSYYTLDGNGSAITSLSPSQNLLSGTPASGTTGAAVYLTSCTINGIAENPCVINGTSFSNATGTQSGGGPGPIFFLGSSPCGQTLPIWSTLVGVFAGVFGFLGTTVACFIGEAISAIVLILVIVLVIYLIAAVVRGSGNRRRSSDTSTSMRS